MRNIEETGSPRLSRRTLLIGGAALDAASRRLSVSSLGPGAALDGAAAARRARMSP
jgi:hypothetical protein